MKLNLEAIEEAARAASPGPWVAKVTDGGTDIESHPTDVVVCTIDDGADDLDPNAVPDPQAVANGDYLQLLDPETVCELVRLARIALTAGAPASADATAAAGEDSKGWLGYAEWEATQRFSPVSPEASAAEEAWNSAIRQARAIASAASKAEATIQAYAVLVDTELELLMT